MISPTVGVPRSSTTSQFSRTVSRGDSLTNVLISVIAGPLLTAVAGLELQDPRIQFAAQCHGVLTGRVVAPPRGDRANLDAGRSLGGNGEIKRALFAQQQPKELFQSALRHQLKTRDVS